jgi:Max protein
MSDEGEIDVESDDVAEGMEGDDEVMGKNLDKRAHHNALERKRRDHIKDSFTNLRDCIPSLSGEKVSRAHVLNKATEYIRQMQKNSSIRSLEIEELKKKNEILEEQGIVMILEC